MDSFQMSSKRSWVTRWINYKHYFCMSVCGKPLSRRASVMSSSSTDPSRGPVRSHLLRKAKRKSLRMSFVIVMAFIVCWAPYYIFFFYVTFLEKIIDPMVFNCFSFIGLSNSMLNPMIYGAFQLCKVQFYTPSSWRRNVWRGTSPKLQSSNQNQNHHYEYQPDTPASSTASGDSHTQLLTSSCQCQVCNFKAKDSRMYIPLLVRKCNHFESGDCWTISDKQFADGSITKCPCFHSY